MSMLVLGLESSCDETACAVVETDPAGSGDRAVGLVRGEVVRSQLELHRIYGGVVPEIASRAHLEAVDAIVGQTLGQAGLGLGDLSGLAVTQGPGLVGALLVAVNFAKGLSMATGLEVAGVNHVQAHALAPFMAAAGGAPAPEPAYPLVALVASGGHTSLFLAEGPLRLTALGRTVDDAAGEAFDKCAKLIGLGYPGGPAIEALARDGDPGAFKISRPMWRQGLDFSFSGLKTRVQDLYRAGGLDREPEGAQALRDLAASFQAAVIDVLIDKLAEAARRNRVRTVVLSGGVAANGALRRAAAQRLGAASGPMVLCARPAWCADNGAMIAYLGAFQLAAGRGLLDLAGEARPRWPVGA